MKQFFVALAMIVVCDVSAQAAWSVGASDGDEIAGGAVRHVRTTVEDSATDQRAELHFAIFDSRRADLRIVDQANEPRSALAELMQTGRFLAGVNGGYFDPQDAPVGLLIVDGKTIAPLRKARLLSGVMVATKVGVKVMRIAEYVSGKGTTAALQCGPFLIDRGQPVGGLNDTRSARRTFVATAAGNRVALGSCSDVTLASLAKILALPAVAGDGTLQRALNLDGGSSSAFWVRGERDVFSISEWKTVRNFVAVLAK